MRSLLSALVLGASFVIGCAEPPTEAEVQATEQHQTATDDAEARKAVHDMVGENQAVGERVLSLIARRDP